MNTGTLLYYLCNPKLHYLMLLANAHPKTKASSIETNEDITRDSR